LLKKEGRKTAKEISVALNINIQSTYSALSRMEKDVVIEKKEKKYKDTSVFVLKE